MLRNIHLCYGIYPRSVSIVRGFAAVKELPWCALSDSPTKWRTARDSLGRIASIPKQSNLQQQQQDSDEKSKEILIPIDRFGIVAAMSRNRVIGIPQNKLPWPTLSKDREIFESLTTNKVLIIGRKTFQEEATLCHIMHASHCIVLSKTLTENQIALMLQQHEKRPETKIHVVSSLERALDLARQINASRTGSKSSMEISSEKDTQAISCWIAGGEHLYDQALIHPSAMILHLSVVDVDIDLREFDSTNIARFPPKYRWDHLFEQTSSEKVVDSLSFTHFVFDKVNKGKGRH